MASEAPMTVTINRRVFDDAAFVLQTWDWKETSLLVEFFTLKVGKVFAVARGAKRPSSHFRGIITPFSPLKIAYSGQHEVKNLTRCQWLGGFFPIEGDALFAAFYVNELLVRLTAREDPIEGLFASYVRVLEALAQDNTNREVALRTFEFDLLTGLGYGLPESAEPWFWDGEELMPLADRVTDSKRHIMIEPQQIAALRSRNFSDPETLALAKTLARAMISRYAGDKPLNSRRILQELKRL